MGVYHRRSPLEHIHLWQLKDQLVNEGESGTGKPLPRRRKYRFAG